MSLGIVVHDFKEDMGSEVFSRASLARYAIPLFKQGAKVVGKRALQAATEVGQDVLQRKNVRESVKTRGGDVVKDFAEQGAKALLQQAGRGSKRRQGQRSNLSTTKRLKLCSHIAVPSHTKWITEDDSSHDDESDSDTSQTSDDIY